MPGEVVDPDDLNNLVDLALALPPLITDQTSVNANTGDKTLLVRGGVLKQADVSTFPSGVTEVSSASSSAFLNLVTTTPVTGERRITASFDQQNQKKILAAPEDGSLGPPTFRALVPADLPISVHSVAASIIDWTLGSVFSKALAAGTANLKLNNGIPGQVIKVYTNNLDTAATVVHWGTNDASGQVRWPGGTEPVHTNGVGRIDIYEFFCLSAGQYYGIRWGTDMQL